MKRLSLAVLVFMAFLNGCTVIMIDNELISFEHNKKGILK